MLVLLVLVLAGCGIPFARGSNAGQPTATAPSGESTPTVVVTSQQTFTCPAMASGQQKVFADNETGLRFSYPAAWTESDCQRLHISDGSEILLIGNLFHVRVVARNGLTVQQWVNQQATKDETVSLSPLTVKHADSAYTVSTTVGPNGQSDESFAETFAIVAGSANFYEVISLLAQESDEDTLPNVPLVPVVVQTFDVP
jgi:hypothetical protein